MIELLMGLVALALLVRCVVLESKLRRANAELRRQVDALYSKYFLLMAEYERLKKETGNEVQP